MITHPLPGKCCARRVGKMPFERLVCIGNIRCIIDALQSSHLSRTTNGEKVRVANEWNRNNNKIFRWEVCIAIGSTTKYFRWIDVTKRAVQLRLIELKFMTLFGFPKWIISSRKCQTDMQIVTKTSIRRNSHDRFASLNRTTHSVASNAMHSCRFQWMNQFDAVTSDFKIGDGRKNVVRERLSSQKFYWKEQTIPTMNWLMNKHSQRQSTMT